MVQSKKQGLLQRKFLKIFSCLMLIRLVLYIPVPGVDLDIFSGTQISTNLFVAVTKSLTGSTLLAVGSLGILPYINASILIQFLSPIVPFLKRLREEGGDSGRQEIERYTRYLAAGCAFILSTSVANSVEPMIFDWNLGVKLKIILFLTSGSMFSILLAECITRENLGNGPSIVVCMNIIAGFSSTIKESWLFLNNSSLTLGTKIINVFFAYVVVTVMQVLIIKVQESSREIKIISARQVTFKNLEKAYPSADLKYTSLPIKLWYGGIMPLVFSTTLVSFLLGPLQFVLAKFLTNIVLTKVIVFISVILSSILTVWFSVYYALFVLKPEEISSTLSKAACKIPDIKQGKETALHLEQLIIRVTFLGGIFLCFLAFVPMLAGNSLNFSIIKNLTSLPIVIGVFNDVKAQIEGFSVTQKYEALEQEVREVLKQSESKIVKEKV